MVAGSGAGLEPRRAILISTRAKSKREATIEHDIMSQSTDARPADAVSGNWVDRYAPPPFKPYLRLARADRPIGAWLLLWPCWWSIALAAPHAASNDYGGWNAGAWPNPVLLVLFLIGAMVMRAAGCTFNDIVDKDFDGKVARTRARPIPSGAVSVRNAVAFLMVECVVGLFVLLCLNRAAILLGVASLGLVAIYPFMKRFTYWPQIFLGLAFNWGAILGWAAVTGRVAWPALALYLGGIAWTLVYDTIYAHQDKEDDLLIGVKSTALLFGAATKIWLAGFAILTMIGIWAAGWLAGEGIAFYAVSILAAAHLAWQVATLKIDDGGDCLKKFRANHLFGALVFAAIVAGNLI
jgi:4-hydroxybenzoate polyprenyltransferase